MGYIDKYKTDIPFWLFRFNRNSVKIKTKGQEVTRLQSAISRATLGRLPAYLEYLEGIRDETISAAAVARALALGEVMVRKDLSQVCGEGKPKTGYAKAALVSSLKRMLGSGHVTPAVLAGAGKLGTALLAYGGFRDYGLEIIAAFDREIETPQEISGKPVYPAAKLRSFCQMHDVRIGIITVPPEAAEEVAGQMVASGIEAIWNFSPVVLKVPERVTLQNENLALSLAYLCSMQCHHNQEENDGNRNEKHGAR